jgi:hypothetical protein
MKLFNLIIACALAACFCGCMASAQTPAVNAAPTPSELRTPEEKHLRNVRQMCGSSPSAAPMPKLIFRRTARKLSSSQHATNSNAIRFSS